jgi:NAD(P)-dependent dehydrogenase (short-subunit alcohol dehydrogenase family)
MQTNSISPFLLTKELFPLLRRSKQARIVNHTSMARGGSDHEARYFDKQGGKLGGDGEPEESANFQGPRWERYHQSKLANCTFTYGLQQRLDASRIANVKVLLAHPGVARTGLQETSDKSGGMNANHAIMQQAQTAEDGALGILRACADPEAQSGDFYGPQGLTGFANKLPPEPLLLDPKNLAICWQGCEAAVGKFEI